jgi:hypothetical protein
MRTPEEIQRQIEGLEKERKSLPHYSLFRDDNWAIIDAQLAILRGEKTYHDYEYDEDYEVESAAYNADYWLKGETDEDLFSPE